MTYETEAYEEIELEFLRETDQAFLLSDGIIEAWIPKGTLNPDYQDEYMYSEYEPNQLYTFEIAIWMLKQKGLI